MPSHVDVAVGLPADMTRPVVAGAVEEPLAKLADSSLRLCRRLINAVLAPAGRQVEVRHADAVHLYSLAVEMDGDLRR